MKVTIQVKRSYNSQYWHCINSLAPLPEKRREYLQLIRGKRRVRSAQSQDIHNAASHPGADALILMCQQLGGRQFLRDLFQRLLLHLFLFQLAKLLRQRLQTTQQIGNGNGLTSDAPGQRFVEFEVTQRGGVIGLRDLRIRGALTSARRHRTKRGGIDLDFKVAACGEVVERGFEARLEESTGDAKTRRWTRSQRISRPTDTPERNQEKSKEREREREREEG